MIAQQSIKLKIAPAMSHTFMELILAQVSSELATGSTRVPRHRLPHLPTMCCAHLAMSFSVKVIPTITIKAGTDKLVLWEQCRQRVLAKLGQTSHGWACRVQSSIRPFDLFRFY